MSNDLLKTLTIIFETIQLPIVFLLIFSSYNFISLTIGFDKEGKKTFVKKLKNNPIIYISVAFFINLLYLLINMISGIYENQIDWLVKIGFFFDVLTSYFFLIAFIDISYENKPVQLIKTNISKKLSIDIEEKTIYTYFIRIVCISVLIWFSYHNENFLLYLFSFLTYYFVGVLLYKKITLTAFELKKSFSDLFIKYGFIFWGIIQFLPLLNLGYLTGFGLSAFFKILILIGFYNFYIRYAKYISKKQSEEKSKLETLQDLINEISKCSSVDTVAEKICEHLTQPDGFFRYDYAIISEVDYLKRKILNLDKRSENDSIITPGSWVLEKGVDLGNKDILSLVCKEKEIKKINGLKIDDILYDINSADCPLNKDIFTRYKHNDLNRMIIPVTDLNKEKKVTAIVEVGYHKSTYSNDIKVDRKLLIYIDNCYQTLERLYTIKNEEELHKMMDEINVMTYHSHEKFVEITLTEIAEKINSKFGFIVFNPRANATNTIIPTFFSNNYIADADKKKMLKIVSEIPSDLSLVEGIKVNENKLKELCQSELVCTYEIKNEYFEGMMFFFLDINDENKYNLNESQYGFIKADIDTLIKTILRDFNTLFNQKRLNFVVGKLARYETFYDENIEVNFPEFIADLIQNYFNCDAISIWLKKWEANEPGYKQIFLSSDVKHCRYKGNLLKINEKITPFVHIDLNEKNENNKHFFGFSKDNGYQTMIHAPLSIEDQYYGFINIYSMKKNYKLSHPDINLLKLISNKFVFSLSFSNNISNFLNLSQSLNKSNIQTTLNQVVTSARDILHSDLVILFLTDEYQNITYKNIYYSGKIIEKKKLIEGKGSSLLESIVKDKKNRISDKEKDFDDPNSFQKRENIKSAALFPLVHENKVIGIMCFNYRNLISFDEITLRFIKLFCDTATLAIVNADNVSKLKEKQKSLEFNYAKIYDQMSQLLPTASMSSLMEIIRQVNHDLVQQLVKIEGRVSLVSKEASILNQSDRDYFKNYADDIAINIDRSKELIRLFKPESLKISFENLNTIILSVVNLFNYKKQHKNNTLKIRYELNNISKRNEVSLRCIKAEIAMVIYNLISNSEKAIYEKNKKNGTFTGGTISMKCWVDDKNYSCFEITDNGIGIDNDELEKIFILGHTTREKNESEDENVHGIGLYIVEKTVKNKYGGDVIVHSVKNEKTTFTIKLKSTNDY